MLHPPDGPDWVDVHHGPLPAAEMDRWATRPECGAVVVFSGTSRDHAPGRDGVTQLEYEGYEKYLVERLAAVVGEARRRWPDLVAAGLIHRLGVVPVGEAAVIVAASSAHRGTAFEAARFLIDTAKSTVPIWKKETWADGEDWGLDGCYVGEIDDIPRPDSVPAAAVDSAHEAASTHRAEHSNGAAQHNAARPNGVADGSASAHNELAREGNEANSVISGAEAEARHGA